MARPRGGIGVTAVLIVGLVVLATIASAIGLALARNTT